ncbi:MAG: DUF885 family protein [Gemmataceae bacterium]
MLYARPAFWLAGILLLSASVRAEPPERLPPPRPAVETLDLAALVAKPVSPVVAVARRYDADRGSLTRSRTVPLSVGTARLAKFSDDWLTALKAVDLVRLSPVERDELAALRARVEGDGQALAARGEADDRARSILGFAMPVVGLLQSHERKDSINPVTAAAVLADLPAQADAARRAVLRETHSRSTVARAAELAAELRAAVHKWHGFYDGYDPLFTWWVAQPYKPADAALDGFAKFLREHAAKLPADTPPAPVRPQVARWPGGGDAERAGPVSRSDAPDLAAMLAVKPSELIPVVEQYTGGGRGRRRGPAETRAPADWLAALEKLDFDKLSRAGQVDYVLLRATLERDRRLRDLRAKAAPTPPRPKDDTTIPGRPIGREAMLAELAGELVPYTPEELIDLAKQELAWCEAEIKRASREMGYEDDWKKAVEVVKGRSVPPGGQPRLIRDLAEEAIEYLKANGLVTVPPIAAETWRMEMMTPERQLVNPFFTGGEVISVSYPTNTMTHAAKLQSIRGNNPHFSRATVHHELIPGHHLQMFQNVRENAHRNPLGTSFWLEGWAVYWEMVLYDRGFAKSPEDRVGFLVWRMHRCARVMFSFGFHLGKLSPRQCIDLLVERVGFEPANAEAEVRRSFAGGYGPMYQAAYLVGAMQFRALRKELVDTGKMTDRAFHDAILRENRIPVELVRAILTNRPLTRDFTPARTLAPAAP